MDVTNFPVEFPLLNEAIQKYKKDMVELYNLYKAEYEDKGKSIDAMMADMFLEAMDIWFEE